MDLKKQFSFLRHFNEIKGVGKAVKAGEFDTEWLEDPKMQKCKEKYDQFFAWCDANGIKHPKIKYPVLFGKGDNRFPGCMALEDIGREEPLISVPSHLVISQ